MKQFLRTFFVYFSFISVLIAAEATSHWFHKSTDGQEVTIKVELFLSSTCPHCKKADEFFKRIEDENKWMQVTRYFIDKQQSALELFNTRLQSFNQLDFAVPSVIFCRSRWVGFASEETTGKELLEGIHYCKKQIEKSGNLTPEVVSVLNRLGNVNVIGANMTENPSPVRYIISVSLIDALNPCALFFAITFFSALFIQKSNQRRLLIGSLFILSIAIVHAVQQQFPTGYFALFPWIRIPAAIVGLMGFYYMGQYVRGRAIEYIFMPLILLIGTLVYIYQQTCLVNWSFVFHQWLNTQDASTNLKFVYQLGYQMMYVVPLLLMLFMYQLVAATSFFEKFTQRLRLIGILVVLAVSLFLIIYPVALSNNALSLFVWGFIAISGWVLSYYYTPPIDTKNLTD